MGTALPYVMLITYSLWTERVQRMEAKRAARRATAAAAAAAAAIPTPEPAPETPAPEPEPTPEVPSPDQAAAAAAEKKRLAARRGWASTIRTGPTGAAGAAPVIRKTLLGGA